MDIPAIVKNGFFRSNLFFFLTGQVLTIMGGLMLFAFTWGTVSQEANDNRKWRTFIDATIKRMDSEGTNASKYRIEADNVRLAVIDDRLKAVEGDSRKIDVMAEKISRIDDTLKEMRINGFKR